MQLTQFTDYSLRALIYIALKKETCTIKDIAEAYHISNHHLVKIIHRLGKLGFIKTTRGKHGGIIMAMEPVDINLGKLVLQLEPSFDLVPCFGKNKNTCCIASVCKLKPIFYKAQKAFIAVLNEFTLADVLHNPNELSQLLHIKSSGSGLEDSTD